MGCCRECGCELRGRSDKKFCSDMCRNAFHNRLKRDLSKEIPAINRILLNNRRILRILQFENCNTITIESAILKGLDFSYFTSMDISPDGNPCFFCYDVGYILNSDKTIYIIDR